MWILFREPLTDRTSEEYARAAAAAAAMPLGEAEKAEGGTVHDVRSTAVRHSWFASFYAPGLAVMLSLE